MRREFTKATKALAFQRAKGKCEGCGARLTVGKFHFDHQNPDGLTGEPTLSNICVLCVVCHSVKTKQDVANIARAKRREAWHIGADKKARPSFRGWKRFNGQPLFAKDRA